MSFTFPMLPAPRRRTAWKAAFTAVMLSITGAAQSFSLDDVVARARTLSDSNYVAPTSNLPPVFSQMQFADYLKIKPLKDKFEWADAGNDTPFRLAFYHQGMQFSSPVQINEIVGDQVHEIRYDPNRFDFGDLNFDRQSTRALGYAGFRVLFPVNSADKHDEVMSLLGASYFRVIGKGQVYGLSARGLAIDSAQPGPEEFPRFREFWVQRAGSGDKSLKIYALLDSPSATGAYEFILTPGTDMLLDVRARVFMRKQVRLLGVAPLTSMFLFGPNQPSATPNFRPAIHDTNGLSIHSGSGEWIWRPLNNPAHVTVSSFDIENPRGFGLLQRGREFARYEDLKDRYDLRPSAWIEPRGDWGRGKVTLVEIPTADETNDNIVAFWTPTALPPAGQPLQADYRMHWTLDDASRMGADTAWVKQTLRTPGEQYQRNLIRQQDGTLALMVDFEGPALAALPQSTPVTARYSSNDAAEITSAEMEPNPATRGWRLTLRVRVKQPTKAGELRAALVGADGKTLTETWSFQIPPR